jgi:hypothetical protein
VANLHIHANLIQHYLYTADAPVMPGNPDAFVSVFDGAISHLLTVDSSGQMLHFMPDSTSQSGWRTTAVSVPQPPGGQSMFSITAFMTGSVLNAVVLFETPGGYATTWMTRTDTGQWAQASVTFPASSLLSVVSQLDNYVDNSGNTYVYGCVPPCLGNIQAQNSSYSDSAQFFILFFDESQNAWDIAYQNSLSADDLQAFGATHFRLITGDGYAGYPLQVVWINSYQITFATGSLSPQPNGLKLSPSNYWRRIQLGVVTSSGIKRIIPFPDGTWPDCVLVLSNDGKAYVVDPDVDIEKAVFPINTQGAPSGIAAICLSELNGASGSVALFAIENGTSLLWIARQAGGDQTPTFGAWSKLGNLVEAIAAPEIVSGGPEIYFADSDLNVYHLAQNPTDGVWALQKVAAPTDSSDPNVEPEEVSAIMMHISATDGNGVPVPNAEITVASDQWAHIVVDDLTYLSGPGATVSLWTDPTGNLDVFYHATSLGMPIFTFTSGTAVNSCQADVTAGTTTPVSPSSIASRLAGNDPNHPLTKENLQNYHLVGADSDVDAHIQAIQQLGQRLLPASDAAANDCVVHWRIDFQKDKADFRILTESEAANLRRQSQPASLSVFGFSIGDIFGDAVNFFTNTVNELESVTVSVVNDVTSVVINGVNYTITTARQISAVTQMIFAKIAQGLTDVYTIIKEVIQFLEMLFHWQDILETHRVLKACVNSFLTAAQQSAGSLAPLVQTKISELKADFQNTISGLQSHFGSASFNDYVNSLPSSSSARLSSAANALNAQAMQDAYNQHLARCHYVYSKSKNYFNPNGKTGAAASTSIDLQPLLNQISDSWNGGGFDFIQQTQAIQQFITGKAGSFNNLFDLAVSDFLQAIEDVVLLLLDGLAAIATGILDLVKELIGAFNGFVNKNLNIPIISWLYKYAITGTIFNPGDDLTTLDVLCLIFAVPVTILYKVLYNNSAPFNSDDVTAVQNGLAWPLNMLPRAASSNVPYETLGLAGAMLNIFNCGLSAVADGLAFSDNPPQNLVAAVSYASGIGGAAAQVLEAPWSLWVRQAADQWSTADVWTTVLWCASSIGAICDLVFIFATEGLARYTDTLGPILDSGIGFTLLGLGGAAMMYQIRDGQEYSGWDIANSFIPQFQRPFRFLILSKDDEEVAPFAMAALLATDVVVGFGSFATQLGATIADWNMAAQSRAGAVHA